MLSNCDFPTPPQLQNDREYPDTSKNKSQNFLLSYGGARRESVLRGEGGFDCGSKLSTPPPKPTALATFLFQENTPPEAPRPDAEKSSFEAFFFGFHANGGKVLCTTKPGTQRLQFLDSAALRSK